jgi:muramoyltetrapeptide carboxypeptidase
MISISTHPGGDAAPAATAPQKTKIAIVAPSSYAPDDAAMLRGIARLEACNCVVENYYHPQEKYQRFGADDATRAAQLMVAAADPEVDIVMALRGSYGLSRILPLLDFEALAASGKLFVGYSDFTAFNLGLLAQTGGISFAGPMLCDDFTGPDVNPFMLQQFWQCLTQSTHSISVKQENNPALPTGGMGGMGEVEGTLWGGNLSMLTHLLGSPYFPQVDGGILFLEDVGEHPYRIERMMLQLHHAGVLARQKAVLLGDFSQYRLGAFENGYDFDAMLTFLRGHMPVPLLTGLPFGHIRARATLPVGVAAQLRTTPDGYQLSFSGHPILMGV